MQITEIPLTQAPESVKARGVFPTPLFRVTGRRLLCYQDDYETGKIIVPKQYEGKVKPTSGTVLQIGDGYVSSDPLWRDWECPYQVGDHIAWSKWEDRGLKIDVAPGWWTAEEELEFASQVRPDKKVEFRLVEVDEIWGHVD